MLRYILGGHIKRLGLALPKHSLGGTHFSSCLGNIRVGDLSEPGDGLMALGSSPCRGMMLVPPAAASPLDLW